VITEAEDAPVDAIKTFGVSAGSLRTFASFRVLRFSVSRGSHRRGKLAFVKSMTTEFTIGLGDPHAVKKAATHTVGSPISAPTNCSIDFGP
jgi:hypothetical protein